AQGVGVLDGQHALLDVGNAAVDVAAGEDDVALADLGQLVVAALEGVGDGAGDRQRGVGDAVLQGLVAVGADGGRPGEQDGAGPDGVAADGADGAGVGLRRVEADLEHAAAVGAGAQHVEGLVQLQVVDLDVRQADAEALPGARAARQLVDAVIRADVQVVGARVDDQLPGRQVGQAGGDVGPGLAGVVGAEHL